jgi:hypothetical protein
MRHDPDTKPAQRSHFIRNKDIKTGAHSGHRRKLEPVLRRTNTFSMTILRRRARTVGVPRLSKFSALIVTRASGLPVLRPS